MSIGVKTLSWAITHLTNNTERINACFGRTCTFQWMCLSYVSRGIPNRMRCHFRALFVASSPVQESVGIGNRNAIRACSAVFGSIRLDSAWFALAYDFRVSLSNKCRKRGKKVAVVAVASARNAAHRHIVVL